MTDTGAHPGVRSLLARFENNSQNNTPSPPSRGRSPVDSDNPDSRPLSKVRASFVAVERITSSPSALKKIVPHIGGTGGLQSPLSPTGNNFGGSRKPWDFPPTSNQEAIGGAKKDTTQENLPGSESVSKPQESFELPIRSAAVATPKMEEPTQGKTLSVDQEPSTLHAAKNDSTHKPSSRLSTANHKSPPPSRHPVSSAKLQLVKRELILLVHRLEAPRALA
ncbi:hypothetical protein ASPZODRAFT_1849428 [Penicilliopsis zonata CBS 506.65]|uniref:Uncharacterized protein n=1 Tax=Penicilliopsis zonata CBS 506.65 TaxID=1073090 RepID=A0A1L9SI54_9EURO|nr:hypothetical protein ASPZODRAFT_1849428 [Penicilliopsis zonata CBS 506.65]OJJ46910.1 hypothetical protein ASPZODRAFT_1849428 [Penicilliopsis zonata CBS 506.65]